MGHMAGAAGVEPAHARVKVSCLTAWLRPIGAASQSGINSGGYALEKTTAAKLAAACAYGVDSGIRTHDLQGHNLAL